MLASLLACGVDAAFPAAVLRDVLGFALLLASGLVEFSIFTVKPLGFFYLLVVTATSLQTLAFFHLLDLAGHGLVQSMRNFHYAACSGNAADCLPGICTHLDYLACDRVVECFALATDAESGAIRHYFNTLSLLNCPRSDQLVVAQGLAGRKSIFHRFTNGLILIGDDIRGDRA